MADGPRVDELDRVIADVGGGLPRRLGPPPGRGAAAPRPMEAPVPPPPAEAVDAAHAAAGMGGGRPGLIVPRPIPRPPVPAGGHAGGFGAVPAAPGIPVGGHAGGFAAPAARPANPPRPPLRGRPPRPPVRELDEFGEYVDPLLGVDPLGAMIDRFVPAAPGVPRPGDAGGFGAPGIPRPGDAGGFGAPAAPGIPVGGGVGGFGVPAAPGIPAGGLAGGFAPALLGAGVPHMAPVDHNLFTNQEFKRYYNYDELDKYNPPLARSLDGVNRQAAAQVARRDDGGSQSILAAGQEGAEFVYKTSRKLQEGEVALFTMHNWSDHATKTLLPKDKQCDLVASDEVFVVVEGLGRGSSRVSYVTETAKKKFEAASLGMYLDFLHNDPRHTAGIDAAAVRAVAFFEQAIERAGQPLRVGAIPADDATFVAWNELCAQRVAALNVANAAAVPARPAIGALDEYQKLRLLLSTSGQRFLANSKKVDSREGDAADLVRHSASQAFEEAMTSKTLPTRAGCDLLGDVANAVAAVKLAEYRAAHAGANPPPPPPGETVTELDRLVQAELEAVRAKVSAQTSKLITRTLTPTPGKRMEGRSLAFLFGEQEDVKVVDYERSAFASKDTNKGRFASALDKALSQNVELTPAEGATSFNTNNNGYSVSVAVGKGAPSESWIALPGAARGFFMKVTTKEDGTIEVDDKNIHYRDENEKTGVATWSSIPLHGATKDKFRGLKKWGFNTVFGTLSLGLLHANTQGDLSKEFGPEKAEAIREVFNNMNVVVMTDSHMAVCAGGKAFKREVEVEELDSATHQMKTVKKVMTCVERDEYNDLSRAAEQARKAFMVLSHENRTTRTVEDVAYEEANKIATKAQLEAARLGQEAEKAYNNVLRFIPGIMADLNPPIAAPVPALPAAPAGSEVVLAPFSALVGPVPAPAAAAVIPPNDQRVCDRLKAMMDHAGFAAAGNAADANVAARERATIKVMQEQLAKALEEREKARKSQEEATAKALEARRAKHEMDAKVTAEAAAGRYRMRTGNATEVATPKQIDKALQTGKGLVTVGAIAAGGPAVRRPGFER